MTSNLNVQFSDATEETIVSYFGAPQDPEIWCDCGVLDASDARWAKFYNSLPPMSQAGLPTPV